MVIAVSLLFGLIVLVGLLKEFKQLESLLNRYPTLIRFIPTWSFFAPTPGFHDYQLMYRTILDDGHVEEWQEAHAIHEKRHALCFIWNPEKKFSKSVMDLTQDLMRFCQSIQQKEQILLSIPYLQILNYVTSFKHNINVSRVQFMILSSSRMYDYETLFISEAHSVK